MKTFSSPAAFAVELIALQAALPKRLAEGLDKAAALVEQTAKDRVGEGDLAASISHGIEDQTAIIGSTSDAAIARELGSSAAPPQPFLTPALIACEDQIKDILGKAVVAGLVIP